MAARKPKGIADDIVGGIRKIVSPWLGAPAGQNRSVTQAQGLAKQAAETLDQVYAGGMVKAGVQGNKAVAKQAAINAAALGVGAAVGYGVSKAVSKIVPKRTYFVYHSGTNPKPVHITGQGSQNFHSGTLASALDRQTNVQRWVGDIPDANLSRKAYREDVAKSPSKEFFIDRYLVKSKNVENKQTYVDRAYVEIAENMDKGEALKSVKQNLGNLVQNYDNLKIPKVKPYKNLVEDPNSTSYLIPKNQIGLLKDIKFSGRATMETGYLTNRIGQGGTPSEIIRQEVGSGVNSFTTPKFINPKVRQIQSNIISATPAATIAAAFAGVAVPKKKSRAGKRIKRR